LANGLLIFNLPQTFHKILTILLLTRICALSGTFHYSRQLQASKCLYMSSLCLSIYSVDSRSFSH